MNLETQACSWFSLSACPETKVHQLSKDREGNRHSRTPAASCVVLWSMLVSIGDHHAYSLGAVLFLSYAVHFVPLNVIKADTVSPFYRK